jgi:hypothetical protein
MRAVYYELISIIEYEMRRLAYQLSNSLNISNNNVLTFKDIQKMPFQKIINIFNKNNVILENIIEYSTIKRILDIANSYKHRKGLKRLHEMKKIPDYCGLGTPDDAFKAITDTRTFLIQLKKSAK